MRPCSPESRHHAAGGADWSTSHQNGGGVGSMAGWVMLPLLSSSSPGQSKLKTLVHAELRDARSPWLVPTHGRLYTHLRHYP
eukprot:3306376-Prymnesium_polylepis.1